MTETEKKFTVPGPVPVDAKKLIDGLGTIFGGVIQLLAAMEPNMAKELADMAINGVPKETAPEEINPDDFEEIIAADDLPWDTEPKQPEEPEAPKEQRESSCPAEILRCCKGQRHSCGQVRGVPHRCITALIGRWHDAGCSCTSECIQFQAMASLSAVRPPAGELPERELRVCRRGNIRS